MRIYLFAIVSLMLTACQQESAEPGPSYPGLMEIPAGFDPIEFPAGNAFTYARWNLGKKLFYDPVLSADSSISCASCHPDGHSNGLLVDTTSDGTLGTPKRVLSLLGTRDNTPLADTARPRSRGTVAIQARRLPAN